MCDIVDLEEALKKTGPELFKELYRIYPVADPEDYFKNGAWRNELLKADLVLMEAHRREAGAPDMPDIDDVKFPELPVQTSNPSLGGVQFPSAASFLQQRQAAAAAGQQQNAVTPTPAGGQVVEIRLIALFVAKWKLDPVTAKECLTKLTPARRRYVIQHFKTTVSGMEATEELKKFIEECEKDGKWDAASATTSPANGTTPGGAKATALRPTITPKLGAAVATPRPAITPPKAATVAPAAGIGAKRPIGSTVSPPSWAANKRPALATGNVITPPKAGAAVVKPAITPPKAGAGATIRPPVRSAGW